MKKAKLLALACAVALATPAAFAQFTTGGSGSSSKGSAFASGDNSDYNILGVSYTNEHFSFDYPKDAEEPDSYGMSGFAVKYLHGFSLSQSLPMYIETGLNFNYNFRSEEDDDGYIKTKMQRASLAIPVNFAWKFRATETVAIKPYLGLNFKVNVLTKSRKELTDAFLDDYKEAYGEKYTGDTESDWANYFNKKDMGSKDATWNRFQMGWHIGVDFQFNNFLLGVNYGTDFIPAYKYKKYKTNTSTFNVGIGVCF